MTDVVNRHWNETMWLLFLTEYHNYVNKNNRYPETIVDLLKIQFKSLPSNTWKIFNLHAPKTIKTKYKKYLENGVFKEVQQTTDSSNQQVPIEQNSISEPLVEQLVEKTKFVLTDEMKEAIKEYINELFNTPKPVVEVKESIQTPTPEENNISEECVQQTTPKENHLLDSKPVTKYNVCLVQEKVKLPKVVVYGLKPVQKNILEATYRERVSFVFIDGLSMCDSSAVKTARLVIMTRFCNHSAQERIESTVDLQTTKVKFVNGGLTKIKLYINDFLNSK